MGRTLTELLVVLESRFFDSSSISKAETHVARADAD
ncbi:MAG: hypothetical protein ACI8UO_001277 [Verrucomicrobiales bacterium]